MCYYLYDIIKFKDFDFVSILIDEKSHENILIYDNSYETLIGSKSLRTRLDKIDGFIRINNGTRYLVLFGPEKYGTIYNRIRYLIIQKRRIHMIFSHNFAIILMILYLPLEEILTLHDVIILFKSILNKNQNHYYYKAFLEKCSYQLARN